ncbi:TPA: restriction endonuclease subunit S [Acinetobacter baumannii]|nr:restriction endonuclease subunit S [Acinetobacter baumannii]
MSFELKALKDICTIQIGKTPSRHENDYWRDGTHAWLSIADMNQGRYLTTTKECITDLGIKSSNIKLIPKNTLVLSYKLSIGKVGITQKPMYTNEAIASLTELDSQVDINYLYWALQHIDLLENADRAAMGKTLNKAKLSEVKIPLPPLTEQRRIASILDKADELRQKRQQAIEKLDQLLQAEFMSKFHQKNYPEFNVSDLLENEKSMRTGPFGSQLLHSEFVDEGIHVLGIDNAVQNSFNWAKPRFITEEKYKFLKRYTVKPKDVIITIMGTCGKCAVVPDDIPIAINTKHLCCITLDQTKCNPEFLHSYFLLHPTARNYLESRAKGAIMSGLNMGIIKELPVELPPIKIQNEFSILKQKIILQKTLMIKELSKLNELFTSLQIQAFSGTL